MPYVHRGLALVLVVLLSFVTSPRNAFTQDKPEELSKSLVAVLPGINPQAFTKVAQEVARELTTGLLSRNAAQKFTPFLKQAAQATLSKFANAIERKGNSLNWVVSGSVPLAPWLRGTVELGRGGAHLGLKTPIISLKVGQGFDRSLNLSMAYGPPKRPTKGVEVRSILSLKFQYKINEDYLVAISDASGSTPFPHIALEIMDRIVKGTLEPGPKRAFGAAMFAGLKRKLDNLESVTIGKGTQVSYEKPSPTSGTRAGGSVTVSYLEKERLLPGQEQGQGTRYFETEFGFGLGGKVPGYEGSLGASIVHSTDPDKKEHDPALVAIAQKLRDGEFDRFIEAGKRKTALIWDRDRILKGLQLLRASPHGKTDRLDRITAFHDRKVGGVMIYYNPAILAAAIPPEHLAQALQQLVNGVEQGKTDFMLRFKQEEEKFALLSLKEWLATGGQTLGNLTRVCGYILKDDDIVLVGHEEPGRPKIDGDVLTVALNSVYKNGTTPFVSLDPDPADPSGGQKARTGGVPKEFENTEFFRIMLQADYDMKSIALGELKVNIDGFRSWYDILRETKPQGQQWSRDWLVPLWTGVGDVLENGPVVIFESEVQVLTERMRQVGDFLLAGTGRMGPEDREAAANLTGYYREIEKRVDSFYQLHALFDVVKLSAILSQRGVKSPVLDAVADRAVRTVRHKDYYPGIGPKVIAGTQVVIGGGAEAKVRIAKNAFVRSEALARLVKGESTLSLEKLISLPKGTHGDLLMNSAIGDLAERRFADAVAKISRALDENPDLPLGYIFRGLALFSLGKAKESLADLDQAIKEEPIMQGFRGVVKLYLGDIEGARRDVDQAAKSNPEVEGVWFWNATVKLLSLDFKGAGAAIDKLFGFHPLNPKGYRFQTLAQILKRMGPEQAKRWTQMLLGLPIPLALAFSDGYTALQMADFDGAVDQLTKALQLSEKFKGNQSVKDFYALERSLFLLAYTEFGRSMLGRVGSIFSLGQPDQEGVFDRVDSPVFSPDSKRLAYKAQKGSRHFIVLDDQVQEGFHKVGQPVFSPDSKRVAYKARLLEREWIRLGRESFWGLDRVKEFIVVDGEKQEEFDEVSRPAFSPDSKRLAYAAYRSRTTPSVETARRDTPAGAAEPSRTPGEEEARSRTPPMERRRSGWVVLVSGQKPQEVDYPVRDIIFSPDGKRLAYIAMEDEKEFVVVDGQKQEEFDKVSRPVFSPDSKRVVYLGSVTQQSGTPAVEAGPARPEEAVEAGPRPAESTRPNPEHNVVVIHTKPFIVVDGQKHGEFEAARPPWLTPDGKAILFVTGRGQVGRAREIWLNVIRQEEGAQGTPPRNPQISFEERLLATVPAEFEVRSLPALSPDGKHLAYAAGKDGKEFVVVDGQKQEEFDKVSRPFFSPDGKRLAYTARNDKEGVFVVVDGQRAAEFYYVGFPVFSPDSKVVAYAARQSKKRSFLIVDDPESEPPPGLAYADRLIALRPQWASGYLVKALLALNLPRAAKGTRPKALMDEGFARDITRDPLFREWLLVSGTDKLKTYFYALPLLKKGFWPGEYIKVPGQGAYLAELAKATTPEGKMAKGLLELVAVKPDRDALLKVRSIAAEVMKKPGSDVGSIILYWLFMGAYIITESEAGDIERGLKAARAIQTELPDDHPTVHGLTLIAMFRLAGNWTIPYLYEIRSKRDLQLLNLVALAAKGEIDLEKINQRVSELAEAVRLESERLDPPMVQAFNEFMLGPSRFRLKLWVLNQAEKAVRENQTLSRDRRSEVLESISTARERFTETKEVWVSPETRKTVYLPLQRLLTSFEDPKAASYFDSLLERAKTPADLAMVQIFSQGLLMGIRVAQMRLGKDEKSASIERVLSKVLWKIKLKKLHRARISQRE